jgi:hypothetical protein
MIRLGLRIRNVRTQLVAVLRRCGGQVRHGNGHMIETSDHPVASLSIKSACTCTTGLLPQTCPTLPRMDFAQRFGDSVDITLAAHAGSARKASLVALRTKLIGILVIELIGQAIDDNLDVADQSTA